MQEFYKKDYVMFIFPFYFIYYISCTEPSLTNIYFLSLFQLNYDRISQKMSSTYSHKKLVGR